MAMHRDHDESDSNFMQLLRIDDPIIKQNVEKKTDKYTRPQIQKLMRFCQLLLFKHIGDSMRRHGDKNRRIAFP